MKKFLLTVCIACGFISFSQAQGSGFNLGAYLGFPTGSDYTSFSIGLDVNYLFEINEKFSVGPASGFGHSFGKEYNGYDYDDFQYIPIAAAGRFNINDKMAAGLDTGFAVGINDGNDGGFYFRPLFGYNITESIQLNASYIGIALSGKGNYYNGYYYGWGSSWGVLALGATFNL